MDASTALLLASFLSLLNGGVLGLMHRSLLPDVRPAAVDWRTGTLLFAGAGILLGVSNFDDRTLVLSSAYAMSFAGATLYWRATRMFCSRPVHAGLFVPALAGGCLLIAMLVSGAARGWRVAAISLVLAVLFALAARTLQRSDGIDAQLSRRVLYRLLYAMAAAMALRSGYFAVSMMRPDVATYSDVVDVATAIVIPALPVIGTTAFLLMCADHARQVLQRVAETDDLTGLPNRRRIAREGEARFLRATTGRCCFAVAVIDIDFFKRINDRYGHEYGDAALRHVAQALSRACQKPHFLGARAVRNSSLCSKPSMSRLHRRWPTTCDA